MVIYRPLRMVAVGAVVCLAWLVVAGVTCPCGLLAAMPAESGEAQAASDDQEYGHGECCPACPTSDRFWVRGECLLWWTDGVSVPPLVTTSPQGTARQDAGILGRPGTGVLFGDGPLLGDVRWGGRLVLGSWLDGCRRWGAEGEYLAVAEDWAHFRAAPDGDPIFARPFLNVLTGQQDAELVAFPGVVAGVVRVDASNMLQSAGARLRCNLRSSEACCLAPCACADLSSSRLDLLAGYRYLRLDDDLTIREDLVSLNPLAPGSFDITDQFDTENHFHGGEIGLVWQRRHCQWSLEALAKVAFGNVREVVSIRGATTITTQAGSEPYSGGILAQRTNIGRHVRDEFAVVPEVGITLGYRFTERLKATVGYTLVYLSRAARSGDQIDFSLNPNLFPPEAVPFWGDLRPAMAFRSTDFWAQGLTFGVEYLW